MTTTYDYDPLAVTAYHESGHCIGYLHYGWNFRGVRIFEENGIAKGALRSPRGRYDLIGRAVCCMCGFVAEATFPSIDLGPTGGSIGSQVGVMPNCGSNATCDVTGFWTLTAVPEPSSLGVLGMGTVIFLLALWRERRLTRYRETPYCLVM
jgi:hypothetical protein